MKPKTKIQKKVTIYTLVRKGLLPAYKKGKKLYFYEDELLAWIENGRRQTSEQTYEEMLEMCIRDRSIDGFLNEKTPIIVSRITDGTIMVEKHRK